MTTFHKKNLVLVYDLGRDHVRRERMLSQLQEQWQAYEHGEWPVQFSEGRISRLFFHPQGGEHMFELDEGQRHSRWVRQGDDSWYVVGWWAKVEQVVFSIPTAGEVPVVTRIWIGSPAHSESRR